MALALYRKYRPRTFAEVIGQEHVTEPLSQALRSGRLNHAYLFSGPRGCGKTSSARILARSLNCEQGPTPEPCGVCGSCKSLANDGAGSIDVIEIDAASHGGVDDARELREKAFFAPANSRYKIYVIDEAHMVSSAGFNALLKLVEEPPEYVKFIFATTEPEKVLGTIRSRTHHYPFRLIPPATLRPYLQQLTEAEGVHVDPAVFPLVVRAGGGSARDTLSVLDQLIAGAGPEGVSYPRAVALLGVTDVTLLDEMCDALAAGDGAAAYQTIDRVAEAGHDPRRFASDLLERFRDLIVLQQVPDAVAKGLIDGPADQLDQMTAQATRLGPATLSRCADIVHNGLVEMRGTTAPRLLLELITARMLLPGADDSSNALLQRLERMERRFTGSGAIDLAAAPPAQAPGVAAGGAVGAGDAVASGGGGISAARAALAAAGRRGGAPAAGGSAAAPVSATPVGASDPVSAAPAVAPVSAPTAPAPTAPAPTAPAPVSAPPAAEPVSAAPTSPASRTAPVSSSPVSSVPASNAPVSGSPVSGSPVSGLPVSGAPGSSAPVSGAGVSGGPVSGGSGWAEPAGIMPDAPEDDVDLGVAAVPGQLTAASIRERWPEVMVAVGRQSKKIAALAQGATVRDFDGQTLVLTFRFPAHARMVAAEPQLIADALYEEFGARWSIRCDVAGDGGGGGGGSAPRRPQGPSPRDNGGGAREPAPAGPPAPAARAGGSPEPARAGGSPEPARAGGSPDPVRGGGSAESARAGGSPESARAGGSAESVRAGGSAQAERGGGSAESARAGGSFQAERGGGSGQVASVQAQSRGREPAPAQAAAAEDDDGGWPEPVRPGGSARSVVPESVEEEDDDNEWPETATLGGQSADPGDVAALRSAPAAAGAPVGPEGASMGTGLAPGGGPEAPVTVVPTASPDDSDNPPWDVEPAVAPTASAHPASAHPASAHPTSAHPVSGAAPAAPVPAKPAQARPADPPAPARAPAASSAIAAARAAAARGGAPTNRPGAATRGNAGDSGGAAAGNAAPAAASPVRSAAQAAALKAAANRGGGSAGNNSGAWADGSPTEEAPYDPEYDGPPRHADPKATIEGFDPGDEPLDEVIDEKTARQSSEQQAMQLLRDAFGAETISES
ncbi:DNA polymerase III subunit gamma and tau [Winogradskya humida]|uniref:DNA-directed DNA polymerase n=1 Tax=Winogradskya humida TaxID=113566 RepID=A0ABQ4A4U1_9ACTN|nr:DNA polymerase III subunit gamma and tau [Actinoplanes humidus]GIE25866.1 hypothetical protein Ahu01nite_089680 [Actinoplanes humidus]